VVVVARFVDERRAQRMRAWLYRSYIPARLSDGPDGRVELLVPARDEHRALDLLVTLFWGLDIDHIGPEPVWQRAMTLENALLGGAIALVVSMVALLAWWVVPVLAVIPIGTIGLVMLGTFLVVAAYPGRTALRSDPFRRR
jgi:hypothetical protein